MPLLHLLRQNPVIAAVKDNASLQLAIDSECQFISVLYGNICTISNIVKKIKNAGKYAFIHVDLLEGASNKEVVIQFLKLVTEADGIISTKASMLKAARAGNDSNLLIVFYVQIMPDDFVMQFHR
ncbi:glycerol-3-phosphate responsive antiterminator, partial [Escherichia coli]|nr:glycerol-3-phosphate responsive antiterminator [Escherichia coli]